MTLYLAKWCVNSSRMNYLARTTPHHLTRADALDFDKAVLETIGASCTILLSAQQRVRCGFGRKKGGLGLRSIANSVDAAYIASRSTTDGLCRRMRPEHKAAHRDPDGYLQDAIASLRDKLPGRTLDSVDSRTWRKIHSTL